MYHLYEVNRKKLSLSFNFNTQIGERDDLDSDAGENPSIRRETNKDSRDGKNRIISMENMVCKVGPGCLGNIKQMEASSL